jgi:hypothetical protein
MRQDDPDRGPPARPYQAWGGFLLAAGILAAVVLLAFAAAERRAAAGHRAGNRASEERLAALAPRVRHADDLRALEEREKALREKVAALAGPRVDVPALLEAVAGSGSDAVYLDALSFDEGRVEIRGCATAADEGKAREALALLVGNLERRPVLANVAAREEKSAEPDPSGATALPFVVTAAAPAEGR